MKKSTSEFIELRGIRTLVRMWGPAEAPKLFLLHGWMDVSATFQFMVDALTADWRVIAPDWRGFGQSHWNNHSYWFPDYVADLEALLDHYSPDAPVRLIGHSMGGNVAGLYAGIRPERIVRLVSLEGLGLHASDSSEAPQRYASWLDQLRAGPSFARYANYAEFAARLQRGNSRLTADRAKFLAEHLGREIADKQVAVAGDPFHKLPNPVLYRLDEAKACWRKITAPVLWLVTRDAFAAKKNYSFTEADLQDRIACFRDIRVEILEDAGHNMHHDQPELVARLVEEFCA